MEECCLSESPIASSVVCISVHCWFDFSANCHIETALSRITRAACKFHWVLATSLFLLMHFDTTEPLSFLEAPLLVSEYIFYVLFFSSSRSLISVPCGSVLSLFSISCFPPPWVILLVTPSHYLSTDDFQMDSAQYSSTFKSQTSHIKHLQNKFLPSCLVLQPETQLAPCLLLRVKATLKPSE